jgi:hypothetical protein
MSEVIRLSDRRQRRESLLLSRWGKRVSDDVGQLIVSDVRLALHIWNLIGDKGGIPLTLSELAQVVGVSKQSVIDGVQRLIWAGHITVMQSGDLFYFRVVIRNHDDAESNYR